MKTTPGQQTLFLFKVVNCPDPKVFLKPRIASEYELSISGRNGIRQFPYASNKIRKYSQEVSLYAGDIHITLRAGSWAAIA